MSIWKNKFEPTCHTSTESGNSMESMHSNDNPGNNSVTDKEAEDIVDVLIAGAGIGGLVTAICLHRGGFSVKLYEKAQRFKSIGFGVNLQPYCVKLLYELGFEDEMNKIGVKTKAIAYYSRHGQYITKEPRGIDAGYKWPMYSMHRGDFHQFLINHVHDKMGRNYIQFGHNLVAFRSLPNFVEVDFINRFTGELITKRAKTLVCADGINSAGRKILYPDEGSPLWSGTTIWRGITPMEGLFLDGRTMIAMGNPKDREFIIFPVNDRLVNWAFTTKLQGVENEPSPILPDWNSLGSVEDILPLIAEMKLDFIEIDQIIKSSTVINRFPMTDREPLQRWTYDRVTLLGDAAHPMYPNGGNGASQSIIDGRGLLLCLRRHGATPEGLKAYDDLRRTTSSTFVLAGREFGPDKILKVVDERSPSVFRHISDVIKEEEIENMFSMYRQLVGWNVRQLNEEPAVF